MLKTKELVHIILAIILFTFVISFPKRLDSFVIPLIISTVVISTNVLAKKLAAYYYMAEAEVKILQMQRWGYYARSHFKSPKPIGAILPPLLVIFSYPSGGFIKMLTFLQTDVTSTLARVTKKRGWPDRFAEITDFHNGIIIAWGIIINLVIGWIIYFTTSNYVMLEITKYSFYYCAWNMIPLGQIDGTKIFFVHWAFWVLMLFFTVISLIFGLII